MSPEIARKVIALFQKTGPSQVMEEDLTAHELRLLKLLAEGYSYQALAQQFHISINTVRNYIRSIYEKLHVHRGGHGHHLSSCGHCFSDLSQYGATNPDSQLRGLRCEEVNPAAQSRI
jgi:DNA-binding NarL/FixJ family response regulator